MRPEELRAREEEEDKHPGEKYLKHVARAFHKAIEEEKVTSAGGEFWIPPDFKEEYLPFIKSFFCEDWLGY